MEHFEDEPRSRRAVRGLLAPGMTFVDAGAFKGDYTFLARDCVGDEGQVIAFEPTPHLARRLQEACQEANYVNVTVHEVALTDRNGWAVLSTNSTCGFCNSIVQFPHEYLGIGESSLTRVCCSQLDTFFPSHHRSPALIKADIEGAELMMLRGAHNLLTRPDPPALILEINPSVLSYAKHTPGDIRDYLHQLEFTLFLLETFYTPRGLIFNAIALTSWHFDAFPGLRFFDLHPLRLSRSSIWTL